MILVKAELLRHGVRHLVAVAGEHDAALDARSVQVGDGLLGVILHDVGDDDVPGVRAVDGDMQDGAGDLAVVPAHIMGGHELVVPTSTSRPSMVAATPWPDSSAACSTRPCSMTPS